VAGWGKNGGGFWVRVAKYLKMGQGSKKDYGPKIVHCGVHGRHGWGSVSAVDGIESTRVKKGVLARAEKKQGKTTFWHRGGSEA